MRLHGEKSSEFFSCERRRIFWLNDSSEYCRKAARQNTVGQCIGKVALRLRENLVKPTLAEIRPRPLVPLTSGIL